MSKQAEPVVYPEHEKLDSNQLNTIREFCEYLDNIGYSPEPQRGQKRIGREELIVRFFGADPVVLEKERQQMLDRYRQQVRTEITKD